MLLKQGLPTGASFGAEASGNRWQENPVIKSESLGSIPRIFVQTGLGKIRLLGKKTVWIGRGNLLVYLYGFLRLIEGFLAGSHTESGTTTKRRITKLG